MSSLFSRSAVLALARLTNYVVLLLSPIFLVRVLSIETYGQYREFVLYALLAATLLSFSVGSSILYFVAKDPQRAPEYIGNSVLFLLTSSVVGLAAVYLMRGLYLSYLSFDYIGALVLYVFFFLNLDVLDSVWLATKQVRLVFIYTSARTVVRMVAVIAAAMIAGDIETIIHTMIGVEAAKFVLLLIYMIRKDWLRPRFDIARARDQLQFLAPLAIAAIVYDLSQRLGSVYISTQLGAVALAIYSTGIYQIPIIGIVRSAITDAIFPEMVERGVAGGGDALKNWRHANVILVAIVLPLAVALIAHARIFVQTLFTAQYLDAAPIFQVAMLLMVRQCFELGSPLRAGNATRDFFRGNFYALIINLALVITLVQEFGSIGAIVSLLLAEIYLAVYLARRVVRIYRMSVKSLFSWHELSKITLLAILLGPLLMAGYWVTGTPVIAAALGSLLYFVCYALALRRLRIPEIERVYMLLSRAIGLRVPSKL